MGNCRWNAALKAGTAQNSNTAAATAGGSFLEERMEIFTKPFDMDILASRIREMIERR